MSVKNTQVIADDVALDEATAAADTLKPGAGSGGTQSRAEVLATFTQLLSQLGKEDLSHFYTDALALIGKEADNIPNDAAAKNRASVSMKEDVDEMFANDDLSEDFKTRATTIVEAVVESRVIVETARLEEEFEQAAIELDEQYATLLEEQTAEIMETLVEKLDKYLDRVVENWLEDNAVAIENSLRAEIAEDFIAGLRTVFVEHHITVPESGGDLVAELKAELDETRAALDEAVDAKLELETLVNEATAASVFDEVSEGLVATQVEKLRTLAEGVSYNDESTYRQKLELIKENYFGTVSKPTVSTGLITEEIDGEDTTPTPPKGMLPGMDRYVTAISKSAK